MGSDLCSWVGIFQVFKNLFYLKRQDEENDIILPTRVGHPIHQGRLR